MAIIVGKKNRTLFIEEIDFDKGEVTFTKDPEDAFNYPDHWKPEVELKMVNRYFGTKYPEQLEGMGIHDYYEGDGFVDYTDPNQHEDDE